MLRTNGDLMYEVNHKGDVNYRLPSGNVVTYRKGESWLLKHNYGKVETLEAAEAVALIKPFIKRN